MPQQLIEAALFTPPVTQSVTLAWDPSISTNIVSYIVYYGTSSQNYSSDIVVGDMDTVTISGLANGTTYYFVVVAIDSQGIASPFSNQVTYTTPSTAALLLPVPELAGGFTIYVSGIAGYLYVVQSSTNLANWISVATNAAPFYFTDPNATQTPHSFYRTFYLPSSSDPSAFAATLIPTMNLGAGFVFRVSGIPGYQYIVQSSTNLANWVSVATNTAPFTFTAPNAGQLQQCFYRTCYIPL